MVIGLNSVADLEKLSTCFNKQMVGYLLLSSVVDPDPYWIRSQELCGTGST